MRDVVQLVIVCAFCSSCGRIGFDLTTTAITSDGASGDGASDGGGSIARIEYLKASNTGGGDLFGYRLAFSADGTTLVVSAQGEASAAIGI
ncbi:MAG TPA: hypothetical protein VLB44_27865, partial [Kofleriaceae bacterium]|nr:hypothetical protein [Kofleriaceae bacterium]